MVRFDELAEQAHLVGDYAGHLTAVRMGELMADPAAWYREAAASGCSTLLGIALTQWLTTDPDAVPLAVLCAALDDARTRPAAISAVLARGVVDRTGELVIDSMGAEATARLDMLFHREADDVMHRLLVHAEPAIAASAAVSFDMGARARTHPAP
ncbi:hypothetical protein J7E96_35565 [Streptomyces sp. ISL-96]|uniref:hypothetical protein n=1 Tax=Streptomyces sp. ISL-96 TaxID=2819191 RepID=UPI001BE9D623|nr:hypothetical protein [Streptomyces sp. ISL-96]MBT2493725.1 hypothetical protein [Streptomyces sp. ISL-96]